MMATPRETAQAFHDKAMECLTIDSAHAYRLFASSVFADPDFKEGWYKLGTANADLGFLPAAVACWRRVVEMDPNDVNAMNNLGHRLYHMGKISEAKIWIDRLLELEPENPHGWCNRSILQSMDGLPAGALLSAKKAFQLLPAPVMEMQLAFAHLYAGDWANGLKHYRARFALRMQRFLSYPMPQWDGEDAKTKTVLVVQDMGFGDALSCIRFLPLAAQRVGTIALQIKPELMRLVGLMLRDSPNIVISPLTQEIPAADYWCAIGDLPVALALDNDQIERAVSPPVPYSSLAATVDWKVPGRKFHIGIAWAGAPDNDVDHWRSMTIHPFLELCKVNGVQLYGLQVGEHAQDIYANGALGIVRDMSTYIRDFADTAAIVRDLDLVITVESALRHLCGVLGVKCWVPTSRHGGDWRCGRQGFHPLWDPETTLFRQYRDATWPPVFADIVTALHERIGL